MPRTAASRSSRRGVYRTPSRVAWLRRRFAARGASGSVAHPAAVLVDGTAAVVATATLTQTAQAAVAGTASVSAGAVLVRPASVVVAAEAAVAVEGTRTHAAQATIAGQATVLAQSGTSASATVAAEAQVVATATQTHGALAVVAGTAQVLAGAAQQHAASVVVDGQATVIAGAARVQPASVTVAATAQVVADGRRVHQVQAVIAAQAGVLAGAVLKRAASVTIAGAARVTATARIAKPGLNVSLWAVTAAGGLLPLPAPRKLDFSRERNTPGSVTVEYPANAPRVELLSAGRENDTHVEVEIWLGGSHDGALRARLLQTAGDDDDARGVWGFAGHFLEQLLDGALVYPQPAPAEKGELQFSGATAGTVMATVLNQAQARGALTSLTRDWTTTHDSSGQPWPSTVSGLKFSPKTTLLQVAQELVDLDLADFEVTRDRVLRLWAPGRRGVDRSIGNDPATFRHGRTKGAPTRHSVRDAGTSLLVLGADGVYAEVDDASALARRGERIEKAVDAGQLKDSASLLAYGQAAKPTVTAGLREIRHDLVFGPGDPRPGAGFDIADTVVSERPGGARLAVQLQQYTLAVVAGTATSGEVVLGDRISSRAERILKQLEAIRSGVVVVGTSAAPEEDTQPPAAPTGVTVDSLAYTVGIDTYATLLVGWAQVTANADLTAADDVAGYRVQWRPQAEGVDSWRLGQDAAGAGTVSTSFGGVGAGIDVLVRVAAYDTNGNQGEWSEEVVLLTATDDDAPPTPSTPIGTAYLGQAKIAYDGKGSAGEPMPDDTDVIELHKSLTSGFTATDATAVDTFSPNIPGERVLTDLDYGGTIYVRLVARDRAGNRSAMSAQASVVPSKVVNVDLGPEAVERAAIKLLAVDSAQMNLLAVNDAQFGSASIGKMQAGVLSVAVTNAGIIRSNTTGQRYELDAVGLRFYSSSGTQTAQLNGAVNWLMGEFRTALSGTRMIINPGGTDPDEMRFYPSSGSAFAKLETRTFEGQALIDLIGGTTRSDGATGQAGAHPGEGYIRWGDPTSNDPNTTWIARQFEAVGAGGSLKFIVDLSSPNVDGGNRRMSFERHSSAGSVVANSILWLVWNASNQPWWHGFNTNSGVVFQTNAIGIVDAAGNAQTLVCSSVSEISSEEAKGDIRDARAVLDPLQTIHASRSQAFEYLADRWRKPPPTEDDPDPDPVPVPPEEVPTRFGPIAEDLPPELQETITLANGSTVLGTSLNAKVGVIWGALGQIRDQRLVHTQAAIPLPATMAANTDYDVTVAWEGGPAQTAPVFLSAVPNGPSPLQQRAITVRALALTTTEVTVRIRARRAVLGLDPEDRYVVNAAFLFTPPYVPPEVP